MAAIMTSSSSSRTNPAPAYTGSQLCRRKSHKSQKPPWPGFPCPQRGRGDAPAELSRPLIPAWHLVPPQLPTLHRTPSPSLAGRCTGRVPGWGDPKSPPPCSRMLRCPRHEGPGWRGDTVRDTANPRGAQLHGGEGAGGAASGIKDLRSRLWGSQCGGGGVHGRLRGFSLANPPQLRAGRCGGPQPKPSPGYYSPSLFILADSALFAAVYPYWLISPGGTYPGRRWGGGRARAGTSSRHPPSHGPSLTCNESRSRRVGGRCSPAPCLFSNAVGP